MQGKSCTRRQSCPVKGCYAPNLKKQSNHLIQVHGIRDAAKRRRLLQKAKRVRKTTVQRYIYVCIKILQKFQRISETPPCTTRARVGLLFIHLCILYVRMPYIRRFLLTSLLNVHGCLIPVVNLMIV